MKKLVYITVIVIFGSNRLYAQSDSLFDAFGKEFEAFNMSAEKEFNKFQTQNDSAFLKFLEESWQEFEVFQQFQPERPKPKYQPEIEEKTDTISQKIEIETSGYDSAVSSQQITGSELEVTKPVNYQSRAIIKTFEIYGLRVEVFYYPESLPSLNAVNDKSISAFYRELFGHSRVWNYNLHELYKIKQAYHFNDWGYYNILIEAAENIFNSSNEQTLFVWYALLQSGYRIKVGYNDSYLFLLLPTQQELYNIQYLKENNLRYYLFQGGKNQPAHISTYPGFYTDHSKIFSFSLDELPVLPGGETEFRQLIYKQKSIGLEFNSGAMDFLSSYPQCALPVYFSAPLSSANLDILDKIFIPLFKNKTDREKVDILLNFIQGSIEYKIDQEQFGKERYMFAEECLYYPFSDCEDRSVLLGQLVKHFTGLPAIGLEFSEHVTLAVHFPDEEYGNYVLYEGKKYFICDSTYINATSGMIPEDIKKEKPKIIIY